MWVTAHFPNGNYFQVVICSSGTSTSAVFMVEKVGGGVVGAGVSPCPRCGEMGAIGKQFRLWLCSGELPLVFISI